MASRYRVAALLHSDGVGHAYVAVDERPSSAGRLVMLEMLPLEQRASSAAIEAFVQDARLRERMNHPNVVQTHELVQHEGSPVLVTEYLEGESLATLLALAFGMPEFSLEVRLTILAHAVRGLAFIHQLGSRPGRPSRQVHANVSPHDIVITYDGSVKLSGFGRATVRARRRPDAFAPANLEYSAPERLHASLQPASDVFSAGILLWELVALQRFWNQLPEYEIRRRLVTFDIPDIARLKPQIGGELARICRQALAADPAHRYPSAAPLSIELERFLMERSALVAPATIAGVMKSACSALQHEARQRLSSALDAVQGGVAQRRSEAGIWHVLTKERPMSGSTAAVWATGALGALSIAIAAHSARTQPPPSSDAQPVAIEPVPREAVSHEAVPREAVSHEAVSHEAVPREAVSLPAVPPPVRAGEVPTLAAPERHSATTTIQTLMPNPERRPPSPAARARRARRLIEATPIPPLHETSSTPRDEPALTIRLER